MRNRWYEPATGTFLSPDPVGYEDRSSLYAFCGGDPVNCSDPTGERAATAQDLANIAALKERVAAYQHGWAKNRRASFTDYRYRAVSGLYAQISDVEYTYQPFEVEATTDAEYRRGLAILQNDLTSFQSAVQRADDDGAIYYVPNSASRGFMTRTRADERSARRWDIALNVGFYLTDVVPSWFTPAHVEPVAEISAPGGRRSAIPVSTLEGANLRRPHGNIKNSGLSAEAYSLRNRRTG